MVTLPSAEDVDILKLSAAITVISSPASIVISSLASISTIAELTSTSTEESISNLPSLLEFIEALALLNCNLSVELIVNAVEL